MKVELVTPVVEPDVVITVTRDKAMNILRLLKNHRMGQQHRQRFQARHQPSYLPSPPPVPVGALEQALADALGVSPNSPIECRVLRSILSI